MWGAQNGSSVKATETMPAVEDAIREYGHLPRVKEVTFSAPTSCQDCRLQDSQIRGMRSSQHDLTSYFNFYEWNLYV